MIQSTRSLSAALALVLIVGGSASAQTMVIPMGATIYVEELEHDLDGFIRAEFVKQKVPLKIVLTADEARLVLTGSGTQEKPRAWHEGWLTDDSDRTTGNAMVIDLLTNTLLWAGEAGDRSWFWGSLARGGQRKVASRLVGDLKKAIRVVPTAARASTTPTRPSSPLLTNDDVVQMVVAGIGDDVVIQKIRVSDAQFRLDVDALVQLKGAGVSDTVLSVMLEYPQVSEPRQDAFGQTTITSPPPSITDLRGTNLAGAVATARAVLRVVHDHRNSAFQRGCDGEVFFSADGFRFVTGQSNHSFILSWQQVGRVDAKPDWGQAAFRIQHRLRAARDRTFNFKIIVAEGTGEAELEELLEVADRFHQR